MQDDLVPFFLPVGDRVAKTFIGENRTAMMKFRNHEDARARDAVLGQKAKLLRDRVVRTGMGIVQRDDQRFRGGHA